jgi:hypothetical protein
MSDKIQKGRSNLGEILLAGTFILISILCFPSRSYADAVHIDMVHIYRVTFEGTGTYQFSDPPYEALNVKFSFKTVYDQNFASTPVALSEDLAGSPDTWGAPIGTSGGNLTGTYTLSFSDHQCSGSISGEGYPVYVHAMESILVPGSGYLFKVESADEMALHGCGDVPMEWGFGSTEGRDMFAADFVLPPDALAQGKIIQYVSKNVTSPAEIDGSTQSISWNGTVTFEKIGDYPRQSSSPLPANGYIFSYDPVSTPAFGFDPATSEPVGLGPVADGGDTLDLSVDFSYPSPVDLYLALFAPSLSQDLFLIGPGPSLQPISQGLIKWKENISGPVEETVFSGIPLAALPGGTYFFYLLATPPNSTASYYLWETRFTK